jgi:predicted  nucleic acid-binding Zn-ribbon protein
MKEQLARLYQLQVIDSGLAQHKAWIADLDDGTRVGKKLAAAQADLEDKQKRLRDLEATNRNKELELKSADEERQTKSKRAYGGGVADPKELGALERKIEELKRKSDHLEDELLGLMEQIETLREEVAKQQRIVASGTKVFEQTRADYAEARGKLEAKMKELLAQRQELVPQIDATLLKEYDTLRAKLEGVAVSGVDGNLCQTCRNVLPQSTLTQLKMGKTVVKCQNCRRILYPSDAW